MGFAPVEQGTHSRRPIPPVLCNVAPANLPGATVANYTLRSEGFAFLRVDYTRRVGGVQALDDAKR